MRLICVMILNLKNAISRILATKKSINWSVSADNADLFIDEEEESVTTEFLQLKMRLADFGLRHDASRIMEQPRSKMQRDWLNSLM